MSCTPRFLLAALALAIVIPLAGCVPTPGQAGAAGSQGPAGETGPKGEKGDTGASGATGATGARGATGATGAAGPSGAAGGATGPAGPQGVQGIPGPIGAPGSGESALFYRSTSVSVLPGDEFPFNMAGPSNAPGITNAGGVITLAKAGIYRVSIEVVTGGYGFLVLALDGARVDYTRFGGGSFMSITTLVDTPIDGTVLTLEPEPGGPFFYDDGLGTSATILVDLVAEH